MAATSELAPAQAAFRFLIEVAAIVLWGVAGWHTTDAPARWILAVGLPLAGSAVWGTFRVPGDASASGEAPRAVSGAVRLTIELLLLLGAATASAMLWRPLPGIVLGVATTAHYAMTNARIRWLLAQRPTPGR